ncbi:DNA primase large subunit [Trichonephila inaurata madagascariensis]|uniref:DNA primase large subunit n=1 Tax=Trichonephila inaurata madagascariensis TaxID=2747483 RepID=A0A8X6XM43_9ARAC|nr:DNA primase large subunit [Trichonephila inaurata madagascariensis]
MALFYLKPPKGNIEFNKLCDHVKNRLIFLQFLKGKSFEEITLGIVEKTLAGCAESLIEGSLKDRISHYVLRLLCCTHSDLHIFFIQKSYKSILESLVIVAQELNVESGKKVLKVPFTAALKFVEKRIYTLNAGYVQVPIHAVKPLLAQIFEEVLIQGLNQIANSHCIQELRDHRMQYMLKEIKQWFKSFTNAPSPILNNIIREENLNLESERFPPCMANLHMLLRRNHRLQHNSRVQYILYLKEIGVPCEEVISLFKKEYSIPEGNKEKPNSKVCNHSWNDSENRYIYSIEHLYGKRGSRKNYRAHSCKAIQSSGNYSGGGCPFACFDESNLVKVLQPCCLEVEDIEDIKSLVFKKKYVEACYFHLLMKMKSPSVSDIYREYSLKTSVQNEETNCVKRSLNFINQPVIDFTKPSEYFFLLKNFKQSTGSLPSSVSGEFLQVRK